MEFVSIFTNENESLLWAVSYPEHQDGDEAGDVFSELMNNWTDTSFIRDFLKEHMDDLQSDFWKGMTIDQALSQILREAADFEDELLSVEDNEPQRHQEMLDDIFQKLHANIYSLNFKNEMLRKAKPDFPKAMLRLYAIRLSDGTLVITGGGIKLSRRMEDELADEKKQLERVQQFLHGNGITDRQGLIN